MAEEAKAQTQEASSQEEAPAKPKGKGKLLIFVVAGLLVLGGGGAAAFFFLGGGSEAEASPTEEEAKPEVELVPLDTFLVNLSDPGGERYMKLTLRLAVSPPSMGDTIKQSDLMLARIRDRILTLLAAKRFADVSDAMGKEALRREIQAQVNSVLDGGHVEDVLFAEFVVQ